MVGNSKYGFQEVFMRVSVTGVVHQVSCHPYHALSSMILMAAKRFYTSIYLFIFLMTVTGIGFSVFK